MFINDEAPCNLLTFNIDGHGDAIPYYEINGHRYVLDREIKLTYNTLVRNDSTDWEEQEVVESFAALDQGIEVLPPLCNTEFILSGDRFLREWGIDEVKIDDHYYTTHAVGCGATAILVSSQGEETKLDGGLMDGSAPVHILFKGYYTDAVAYRKWEMATDADFENVILQWNQDEVDYTFIDAGTYYMRYMVANDVGSCEAYSDTYTIDVAVSSVGVGERGELPNVFSPGSTPGVNDTWKVPHKSIIDFHCWIFNRWGTLIYEFTDPDGEWDGKYQGKYVDTGVYYCVVTATGSDGKKYKKRGSITVMRYKRGVSGGSGGTTSGEVGN